MQSPPEIFILWKFHNGSFYTACSGIFSESLDGMPVILTLLENEQHLQLVCKHLVYIWKTSLFSFNDYFQIVNESIKDNH